MNKQTDQGPGPGAADETGDSGSGSAVNLPDAIVEQALRSAVLPLDPDDPNHDQFLDAELEKCVALLKWCDEVGTDFWRNKDIPLFQRIAMTCGEDTVKVRRMLQDAKLALAKRRGQA